MPGRSWKHLRKLEDYGTGSLCVSEVAGQDYRIRSRQIISLLVPFCAPDWFFFSQSATKWLLKTNIKRKIKFIRFIFYFSKYSILWSVMGSMLQMNFWTVRSISPSQLQGTQPVIKSRNKQLFLSQFWSSVPHRTCYCITVVRLLESNYWD